MAIEGKHYTVEQIGPLENLGQHSYRGVPGKRFIGTHFNAVTCISQA